MKAKTVAFYLPQSHSIPENDKWWGEGFTEWTNVDRARPLFRSHDQPKKPTVLGRYDLTDGEVMAQQVEMAKAVDVDAFCFYFYWFDGHRLLQKPVDAFAAQGHDFEYCLSWANEAWTRRWDGKEHEVLMPQSYGEGFEARIFNDLLPHLRRPNYLRVDGKPVLVVHRVTQLPGGESVARTWQGLAQGAGLPGLYLVAAETERGLDPRHFGFDAAAEFPPVGSNTMSSARLRPVSGLSKHFKGRILDYAKLAETFSSRPRPAFVRHRGVTPRWDNTARRREKATLYVGESPERYRRWLLSARADEEGLRGARGLVFVNAWNEWAEGAHLEPDETFGDAFLQATARNSPSLNQTPAPVLGRPSAAFARSVVLVGLGSLLNRMRSLRSKYSMGGRT